MKARFALAVLLLVSSVPGLRAQEANLLSLVQGSDGLRSPWTPSCD
jgi:hypothetical protein